MTNSMLRGIAVGIILATVLLSAPIYFSPDRPENELTKDRVDKYLAEQELVVISKKEYEDLQTQDKPATTIDTSKPEQKKEEKVDEPKDEGEMPSQSYTLSIVSGMNSLEIAQLLEKQQIISSAKEFDAYLTDNGLNTLIQIGTYDLSSDMSFKTIAEIITR